MKDTIKINKGEDVNRSEKKEERKKKVNKLGIYISLCFIVIGFVWYGVNIGIIPIEYIREQAGPILIVLIGILILIKSL